MAASRSASLLIIKKMNDRFSSYYMRKTRDNRYHDENKHFILSRNSYRPSSASLTSLFVSIHFNISAIVITPSSFPSCVEVNKMKRKEKLMLLNRRLVISSKFLRLITYHISSDGHRFIKS